MVPRSCQNNQKHLKLFNRLVVTALRFFFLLWYPFTFYLIWEFCFFHKVCTVIAIFCSIFLLLPTFNIFGTFWLSLLILTDFLQFCQMTFKWFSWKTFLYDSFKLSPRSFAYFPIHSKLHATHDSFAHSAKIVSNDPLKPVSEASQ